MFSCHNHLYSLSYFILVILNISLTLRKPILVLWIAKKTLDNFQVSHNQLQDLNSLANMGNVSFL